MELKEWLGRCGLVAVLRGLPPADAEAVGLALIGAGFVIIEVPLNSPEPYTSIERLVACAGNRALVGAGTVRRPEEVHSVLAAGGRLIVTPHAAVDVVRTAKSLGMLAIPGFFTATEAFTLLDAGADALKLFPAEASSPTMLKALRAVLPPTTLVVPVGGIGPDSMRPWVGAGAAGFGTGSSLYRPGDTASLVGDRARDLVAALRTAQQT